MPARLLVNGGSIVADPVRRFTVYHVELDSHDVLLAEGLACESYLDTGNRSSFGNTGQPALHAAFDGTANPAAWTSAAAPLLTDPAVVEPLFRKLAARSVQLGHAAWTAPLTSNDAALELALPDGTALPLEWLGARHLAVELPAGVSGIRLRSHAASPADTTGPFIDDRRRLGVAIEAAILAVDGRLIACDLADGAVAVAGWHAFEQQDGCGWRWTDGDATLMLPASDAPTRLVLAIRATGRYVLPSSSMMAA